MHKNQNWRHKNIFHYLREGFIFKIWNVFVGGSWRGGGSPWGEKIFLCISRWFRPCSKILKKYGNGAEIGSHPPLMEHSRLFLNPSLTYYIKITSLQWPVVDWHWHSLYKWIQLGWIYTSIKAAGALGGVMKKRNKNLPLKYFAYIHTSTRIHFLWHIILNYKRLCPCVCLWVMSCPVLSSFLI